MPFTKPSVDVQRYDLETYSLEYGSMSGSCMGKRSLALVPGSSKPLPFDLLGQPRPPKIEGGLHLCLVLPKPDPAGVVSKIHEKVDGIVAGSTL